MSAVPRRKVSAENVSHKINKSVTDLFNCTDEITSQQLAAHKKALVAELNSMDDQATESHCHSPRHSFPRLCHCLHRGVQLVDSGAQDGGQVAALFCEDCFCTRSTMHWTCTLSKDLLADTIRLRAKFSDHFEDPETYG